MINPVYLLILLINCKYKYCLENGQALTPPMGFLTWGRFRCITDCQLYPDDCISENLIKRMGRLMVSDGYLDAGYDTIVIDDCWSNLSRDVNGKIVANETRFPNGMAYLSSYLSNLGIRFGIYADIGAETCGGYPGMENNMIKDIIDYNTYNISFIKVDGCHIKLEDIPNSYIELSLFLTRNYPNVTFLCSWPAYTDVGPISEDYLLIANFCNVWRSYNDIDDSAMSLWSIIDHYQQKSNSYRYSRPGAWNDADMLIIGGFGISLDMQKVQMAIWCLMPSPLMISTDLSYIHPDSKEILLNADAISINQDLLGKPGKYYKYKQKLDLWCRDLSDGIAFAIISRREDYPLYELFSFETLGIDNGTQLLVKNVFTSKLERLTNVIKLRINPQGVQFLKIKASKGKLNSSCEYPLPSLTPQTKMVHLE